MPESVPSSLIIDAFKEIFQAERRGAKRQDPLGWIISVPDTHQKSVLAALDKERSLRVLTCSTEDDANAVAAGLYMTGEPVIPDDSTVPLVLYLTSVAAETFEPVPATAAIAMANEE